MPTVVLTESHADGSGAGDGGYLISQPCRMRERLVARLDAWRLDRALADGASPDQSATLSLRAGRLIGYDARHDLAQEVRGILRAAERPRHPFDPGVRVCVREVLRARELLKALADQLDGCGPVDSGGVARVRLLLRDGGGPLYNEPLAADLERSLRGAIDALEPHG
jgi:hypothetical protein